MEYVRPTDLDTALSWLAATPQARVAAGCTDLFPATARRALEGPILDITAIPDLRGITETEAGWRFGAAASWSDAIATPLPAAFDGLKAAAREVGSVQIQNAATLGGNLCNASPAADGVPCWLTLDAEVELRGAGTARRLPLEDFVLGPRRTALARGEILAAIHVPRRAGAGRAAFLKLGARRYLVISIAMVAVRLVRDRGAITEARLAVGACSPVARRLRDAETEVEAWGRAQDVTIRADLSPIGDIRADAAYRRDVAPELVRRAVDAALGESLAA